MKCLLKAQAVALSAQPQGSRASPAVGRASEESRRLAALEAGLLAQQPRLGFTETEPTDSGRVASTPCLLSGLAAAAGAPAVTGPVDASAPVGCSGSVPSLQRSSARHRSASAAAISSSPPPMGTQIPEPSRGHSQGCRREELALRSSDGPWDAPGAAAAAWEGALGTGLMRLPRGVRRYSASEALAATASEEALLAAAASEEALLAGAGLALHLVAAAGACIAQHSEMHLVHDVGFMWGRQCQRYS